MMKNQKIGERHSDLECKKCGMELVWKGGILDGKMTCPNNFCVDKPFDGASVDTVWVDELSGDKYKSFSGSGISVISAPQIPDPLPRVPVSAVMARYYKEVTHAHRGWCIHYVISTQCDCGHLAPCPYPEPGIEIVEKGHYGKIVP